ncbi:sensor histidine kinase [Flavitalea antarctica]
MSHPERTTQPAGSREENLLPYQHTLLMQAPVAIAVVRIPDFRIDMVNERMLELCNKSRAEILNKPIFEVNPSLKTQGVDLLMQQVINDGKGIVIPEIPVTLRRQNVDVTIYLKVVYEPLRENDNSISGLLITALEITDQVTERKKIEAERKLLEESEERSRLAIEATEMGTFDWDLKTGEFKYSERLREIFGGEPGKDFKHDDLIKLIHPDDLAIRNQSVQNCFVTGSLKYQIRLIWPNKTVHWVSVYGKISYDGNHQPVKMYGTAVDISRERNYQRAIEESEEKFRTLANFLPTFIWTTDRYGKLTYFNHAITEFTGLSESEIRQGGWFQLLHPEDRAVSIRRLEKAIQSGTDFQAELRFKNREGEYRWQMGRSVALKGDDGQIQMWIGTSVDIHDQKMMAEELEKRVARRTAELKQANDELMRANQDLEQFAYVSSHDLQEPLRKILTFSDLVLKKIASDQEEVRLHLEKINASAGRMSVLITDLLNYSKVSKADDKYVPINLDKVLEDIRNDFEVLIAQKQAVIKANNLPVVKGIPIQINQLFYNLISNALKFSQDKPVITITAREVAGSNLLPEIPLPATRDYIELVFQDNGIGFEQIYASQIFTIFQRLNNRANYSGTGIGLAICKKIVENHGGYIFATSELNKGATFTVYLSR